MPRNRKFWPSTPVSGTSASLSSKEDCVVRVKTISDPPLPGKPCGLERHHPILLPILTSVLAVEQTYFPHDRNGSALNRFSKRSNRSGGTPQGGAFRQIPFGNVCGYGRAGKRDVTTVLSSLSISGHTDGRIDDGRTSPFLAFIFSSLGHRACRRKFHQSVM